MISPQWLKRAETALAEFPWRVACKLVSCYIPTLCLDSGIVSPLRLRWVKGVYVFRCNLPSALLAEWPGSFTCHCSNTGVQRTPNKSQHTKLTLEKKNSPAGPAGMRTRNLSIWSPVLYQQAVSALKGGVTLKGQSAGLTRLFAIACVQGGRTRYRR